MNTLAKKYSNWQIYGFFGLFLTHAIWTFYALTYLTRIPIVKDIPSYFSDIMPSLGIFVGIPFVVSLVIWYKMHKHEMLSKSNYFVLLLAGFIFSLIFVGLSYF